MNKTQSELAHYAWNPVTGCLNDCRYCYTKRSILRFSSDFRRNMTDPRVREVGRKLFELDEPWALDNGRFLNSPMGFAPTLHRYRLDFPQKIKVGSSILFFFFWCVWKVNCLARGFPQNGSCRSLRPQRRPRSINTFSSRNALPGFSRWRLRVNFHEMNRSGTERP